MLFIIVTLCFFFYRSFCAEQKCEYVYFQYSEGIDPGYPSGGVYRDPKLTCNLRGDVRRQITVLYPAVRRQIKDDDRSHLRYLWVQSPLSDIPFTSDIRSRTIKEGVFLIMEPQKFEIHERGEEPHWFKIQLKQNEDKTISVAGVVHVDIHRREATIYYDDQTFNILWQGITKLSAEEIRTWLERLNPKQKQQIEDYKKSLLRIQESQTKLELFDLQILGEHILLHPFHARADANKWIIVENMHVPLTGKYYYKEKTNIIFKFDPTQRDLLLYKFTHSTEFFKIYWFHQIFGGCVLHSLRAILQEKGEELSEKEFKRYERSEVKPCHVCGYTTPTITSKTKAEHCTSFDYCAAESYLMTNGYGLLLLNHEAVQSEAAETHKKMKKVERTDYVTEEEAFYKVVSLQFVALLGKKDNRPDIIYFANSDHVFTYYRIINDMEPKGFWVNLDSNNCGPRRVGADDQLIPDIKKKIKLKSLEEFYWKKYMIYAVYRPDVKFEAVDLWKKMELKTDASCAKQEVNNIYSQYIYYENENEKGLEKHEKENINSYVDMDMDGSYYQYTGHFSNGYDWTLLTMVNIISLVLIMCLVCCIFAIITGVIGYIAGRVAKKEKKKSRIYGTI